MYATAIFILILKNQMRGILLVAFLLFQEVEDDKEATWQEERSENGQIKPDGKDLEDISFTANLVETKPKRVGVHYYFAIYSILLFKLL